MLSQMAKLSPGYKVTIGSAHGNCPGRKLLAEKNQDDEEFLSIYCED